ncbi:oxygenase MpaB family protein [Streptomyces sp. NPDC002088]|uniref:oxygenase MpaB family protein n=1 Tax=Streptomyces sp. NPDC002088 TaxID=3154665 RepID=UPI003319960D
MGSGQRAFSRVRMRVSWWGEATSYLARMRPQLTPTPAALRYLRDFGRGPAERLGIRVLFAGAVTLLPPWAASALALTPRPWGALRPHRRQ